MPAPSELETKLERVRDLLDRSRLDALLLRRSCNFAWLTCGAASYVDTADTLGSASLLVMPSQRYVITDNIEAPRLTEEEGLARQGWDFQVLPWHARNTLIADLTRGVRLGADTDYPGAKPLAAEVAALRLALTPAEGERFRRLGRLCADGLQLAVDTVHPGLTEYEIAGSLSWAFESLGVKAIVNLIAVDERIFSYRHPLPTSKKLKRYAMLVACGRKWGLVCSLTRLVHFGPLPDELRRKSEAAARIDAAMIAATRPDSTLGDVFREAQAAYAAVGYPDEWKLHHQGGLAGYQPRELIATSESPQPVLAGQAYAWNPSITGAKSEDTILVGEQVNEILTHMSDWPTFDIRIENQTIRRPAILEKVDA